MSVVFVGLRPGHYVMRVGGADVKVCFHRMGIGSPMSEYFVLQPVGGKFLRQHLGDHALGVDNEEDGDGLVSVGLATLPVGFSWNYLVQEAHRQFAEITLPTNTIISEFRPSPRLATLGGLVNIYAENGVRLGIDSSSVDSRRIAQASALRQQGFEAHEEVEAGALRALLGVQLDGDAGVLCRFPSRVGRLDAALGAIRFYTKMTGKKLSRWTGLVTVALAC